VYVLYVYVVYMHYVHVDLYNTYMSIYVSI
jgi:hypothetical protein